MTIFRNFNASIIPYSIIRERATCERSVHKFVPYKGRSAKFAHSGEVIRSEN